MNRLTLFIFCWAFTAISMYSGVESIDPKSKAVKDRHSVIKAFCDSDLSVFKAQINKRFEGQSHDASCRTRMLYLETALDCSLKPEVRTWIYRESQSHWSCMEPAQQYYFISSRGQYFYSIGRLDSSLYFTNQATELALNELDTARFFVGLSNLSALFTEIRWHPEALSSSLWAYDLSLASGDTASLFFAYVINNLVSGYLDMGHVEHAQALGPRYSQVIDQFGNQELRDLKFLNDFRLRCLLDGQDGYSLWKKERTNVSDSMRCKMAYYLSRHSSELDPEQRHDFELAVVSMLVNRSIDPQVKLNYVVPSLNAFTTIPVDARKELLELELVVLKSKNVFVNRDFYEVMAHLLQSSEYWEKYRSAVNDGDSASALYAVVYSNILRTINSEALKEHRAATYGTYLIKVGKVMFAVGGFCLITLGVGLIWLVRSRKKAGQALDALRSSQHALRETEVRYSILIDQIKELASHKGVSVRISSISAILDLHTGEEVKEREQIKSWMEKFKLTRTEAEVLARIALGWTNADLVAELNLAKSYIHNIRGQLRKKLHVPKKLTLEEFAERLVG